VGTADHDQRADAVTADVGELAVSLGAGGRADRNVRLVESATEVVAIELAPEGAEVFQLLGPGLGRGAGVVEHRTTGGGFFNGADVGHGLSPSFRVAPALRWAGQNFGGRPGPGGRWNGAPQSGAAQIRSSAKPESAAGAPARSRGGC
jgi:hypothetical protein